MALEAGTAVRSQLSWSLHGPILHLYAFEPWLGGQCDWYYACGSPPNAECKVHAYGDLAPLVTAGDVRRGAVKFAHLDVPVCGGCVKAFEDWEGRGAPMSRPESGGGSGSDDEGGA